MRTVLGESSLATPGSSWVGWKLILEFDVTRHRRILDAFVIRDSGAGFDIRYRENHSSDPSGASIPTGNFPERVSTLPPLRALFADTAAEVWAGERGQRCVLYFSIGQPRLQNTAWSAPLSQQDGAIGQFIRVVRLARDGCQQQPLPPNRIDRHLVSNCPTKRILETANSRNSSCATRRRFPDPRFPPPISHWDVDMLPVFRRILKTAEAREHSSTARSARSHSPPQVKTCPDPGLPRRIDLPPGVRPPMSWDGGF